MDASSGLARAAMETLSDPMLFQTIASFQRGVPLWAVCYEYTFAPNPEQLSMDELAKESMETHGFMARLAIQNFDLGTLARLYELSKHEYASEKPKFSFRCAMDDAAKGGNLEALQWLHDHTEEGCEPSTIVTVGTNGHADIMMWLLANLPESHGEITRSMMDSAAANGHLEVVQILHEWSIEGCSPRAMDDAAANGHLDVVAFLHENRLEGCTTVAIDRAAENGHLHVLEWLLLLREEGFSTNASYGAAINGHHEVLQCLWENSNVSNKEILRSGIRHAAPEVLLVGDFTTIALLFELAPDTFPPDAIVLAESAGHHEVAGYLRQVGSFREGADASLLSAARQLQYGVANDLLDRRTFSADVLQEALDQLPAPEAENSSESESDADADADAEADADADADADTDAESESESDLSALQSRLRQLISQAAPNEGASHLPASLAPGREKPLSPTAELEALP